MKGYLLLCFLLVPSSWLTWFISTPHPLSTSAAHNSRHHVSLDLVCSQRYFKGKHWLPLKHTWWTRAGQKKAPSAEGTESHKCCQLTALTSEALSLRGTTSGNVTSVCTQGFPVKFINGKEHRRPRPQAARERWGENSLPKRWCRAAQQKELAHLWAAHSLQTLNEMCGVQGEFLWSSMQLQRHSSLNLRELIRIIYVPLQHDVWWSCCGERKACLRENAIIYPKQIQMWNLVYTFSEILQSSVTKSMDLIHNTVHTVSCSACCSVAKYEARK